MQDQQYQPQQAQQPQQPQPEQVEQPMSAEDEAAYQQYWEEQQMLQNQQAQQQWNQPLLPTQFKPIPEEIIVEWAAPSRPFKKRNCQFYSTVAIIVLLISMILFFAGQVLPIAVVISVAFLVYVLYSIPPGQAQNKITTYGIRTDDSIYYWEELSRFWFEDQLDEKMMLFELNRFPWRVILLIQPEDQEDFRSLLKDVLLEQKPPVTQVDKWANWLKEKLPLE